MEKNKAEIVHLMVMDKLIPGFVRFIEENFVINDHVFLVTAANRGISLGDLAKKYRNVIDLTFGNRLIRFFKLLRYLYPARKIVIHGLWDMEVVQFLYLNPFLLKKTYWLIWGGDLYCYRKNISSDPKVEFFRKNVIKRIGHLVTYLKGDFQLARQWYGAQGEYTECLLYQSNIVNLYEGSAKKEKVLNIQIGNSADPSNHHLEVLDKIMNYKDMNIKIYLPLSYGNEEYAGEVIRRGEKLFAEKFIPLTALMPYAEYLDFLTKIDVAIFNHDRQQGMGNTISLLGLGKTVYLRAGTSQWELFERLGVKVFNAEKINLDNVLTQEEAENNKKVIKNYFSKENLVKQWRIIFN